jgi:glucose/arabinose dehydrogenase
MTAHALDAQVVARGLDVPWAFAFIGDGRLLVTERAGNMRVVGADGMPGAPLANVPKVEAVGQGGMLDLMLDSEFARNRTLYFCFSEAGAGGNGTALARARLASDLKALEDVRVIFRQLPKVNSRLHFGCRIVEARDGALYLTLGDRYARMQDAQTLDNHQGKMIRIAKDGSVPKDNPFLNRAGARPEIWSYGHRNMQGATLGPDGAVWTHEHGPQGGDEINVPEAGKNYGWPVITYGENYGGGAIGEGLTHKPGMEQPLLHWTPSIAPSGMAFLTSDRYGRAWQGNLFVGSLKFRHLVRIELDGRKVIGQHRLLEGIGRVRDVRQGPDGYLYLAEETGGRILRLLPPK